MTAHSPVGDPGAKPVKHDDITGVKLSAAPGFDVAVDVDRAVGDDRLGVGAGVDEAGQLEELAQPDRGIPDRNIDRLGA